jgi:hypothetical protein
MQCLRTGNNNILSKMPIIRWIILLMLLNKRTQKRQTYPPTLNNNRGCLKH